MRDSIDVMVEEDGGFLLSCSFRLQLINRLIQISGERGRNVFGFILSEVLS